MNSITALPRRRFLALGAALGVTPLPASAQLDLTRSRQLPARRRLAAAAVRGTGTDPDGVRPAPRRPGGVRRPRQRR